MPAYVTLYRWTDQGVRNVKETVARAREFTAAVGKAGGKVIALYWTQGRYDLVAISELADEETGQVLTLSLGKAGNVRTETMRAFTAEEMERIVKKVP